MSNSLKRRRFKVKSKKARQTRAPAPRQWYRRGKTMRSLICYNR
jgi:hypothetical protein